MATLKALASELHALEAVDGAGFRRRARVLQSMWREEQGYAMGERTSRGTTKQMGSRLPMPWAKTSLANYLTDNIRSVVRAEVIDARRGKGKLYGRPRIFNDLLSSQPLAFNLFGELQCDLQLASNVFGVMTDGWLESVVAIDFEYSPGRGDERYTGDRSAFDVFVTGTTRAGSDAFIGIEVKYHENLKDKHGSARDRYDALATTMACFRPDARQDLYRSPLHQIWRDHLLAGSLVSAGDFKEAKFVFLYPTGNLACSNAVAKYLPCLSDQDTFQPWTIEAFVEALRAVSSQTWIDLFHDRYLDFTRLDARLAVLQ